LTTENLPTTFKKISTGKPKLQGNRIDSYKRLGTTKSKGGFNVKESEGPLLGRCKQGQLQKKSLRKT
jgi:hypothetical protein